MTLHEWKFGDATMTSARCSLCGLRIFIQYSFSGDGMAFVFGGSGHGRTPSHSCEEDAMCDVMES